MAQENLTPEQQQRAKVDAALRQGAEAQARARAAHGTNGAKPSGNGAGVPPGTGPAGAAWEPPPPKSDREQPPPKSDREQPTFDPPVLAAFLNVLLGLREQITLSAINGKEPKAGEARRYHELRQTGVTTELFSMTLDSGVADAIKWALGCNVHEGWNLYWTVVGEDVADPLMMFADFDAEEAAREAVPRFCKVFGVEPRQVHVVRTGTKPYPRYQVLVSPVVMPSEPVARAKTAAHIVGSDITIYNKNRLLRLPGSIAWPYKNGKPQLARIAETVMWTPATERPFALSAPEPFVEPKAQPGSGGRQTFSGASPETAKTFHGLVKKYEILTGEGRGRRKPWIGYYGLLLQLGASAVDAEFMWLEVCNDAQAAAQIGEAIKWAENTEAMQAAGESTIGYGTYAFYLREENPPLAERAFIDKLGQPSVNMAEAEKQQQQANDAGTEGPDPFGQAAGSAEAGSDGESAEEEDPFAAFRDDDEVKPLTPEEADELVRKVKDDGDVGAPFEPETLAKLNALRKKDRPAFEALRARLKAAGVRVTALDDALKSAGGGAPAAADVLVGIAQKAELYVDGNIAYADVIVAGHRETWPVRSQGFSRWLISRYVAETKAAPNSDALGAAKNTIDALASDSGKVGEVHVRACNTGDKIYIDMADSKWRAIEVSATGWRIIKKPPVKFRRTQGMLPLPEPVRGGSITELKPFLNTLTPEDFILAVSWLLGALRGKGPYPMAAAGGEHGTAKTTFCRVLRALIDPNDLPLRTPPTEDRNLFIAAQNGYVLGYDNVSGILSWLSDGLCRIATGGGNASRALYTNDEEMIIKVMRPVILNGIVDIVTRPDLADRTIFVTLEPIADDDRQTEAAFWAAFATAAPMILGALLDAVAMGLKNLPTAVMPKLPRMADFACWVAACEEAFTGLELAPGENWEAGDFLLAYNDNRDAAEEVVIENDIVCGALIEAMKKTTAVSWKGTAKSLLELLVPAAGISGVRSKEWPGSPRALSGRLRRFAPVLRKHGLDVRFGGGGRGKDRHREITITKQGPETEGGDAKPGASESGDAKSGAFGTEPFRCA